MGMVKYATKTWFPYMGEGIVLIMKKSKFLSLILAGILTIGLSGCYFLPDEEEVLEPPTVKGDSAKYSTITATKKDLVKQLFATGTLTSDKETQVYFSGQGGKIKSVKVVAGDVVKKGDVICEIDTSDLDHQIDLKELYIKREKLEKQVLKEQSATQSELDKKQVDIDILQNELDDLVEKKENSVLKAPVSGTISRLDAMSVGDYVQADVAIATIIDPKSVYMAVIPSDMSFYKMNQDITIRLDGEMYEGVVFMIPSEIPEGYVAEEGEIEYLADSVYIRFKGDVPDGAVGQLADSILVLDKRENAIVIANNLIKNISGENVVYLLKDDNKVAVTVEIGLQTGAQSEIISGISEGDEIVIR